MAIQILEYGADGKPGARITGDVEDESVPRGGVGNQKFPTVATTRELDMADSKRPVPHPVGKTPFTLGSK